MVWLLLLILLLTFFIDRRLRQHFNIAGEDFIYRHVNGWHTMLEIVLVIVILGIMYVIADIVNPIYFVFAFQGLLWGLRALFEWKYRKDSKEHIPHALYSIAFLVVFFLLIVFTLPKEINHTATGFMYSDSGKTSGSVTVRIAGTITRNLLSEDTVKGQVIINGKEFLLITYVNNLIKSNPRHFKIIEIDGGGRGDVWLTRDYQTIMGTVEGLTETNASISFAAPAHTIEEAKQMYSSIKYITLKE